MATHSIILAQKIPWKEEPDGLCSPWGCKRVGHNRATKQQHPLGQSILEPGERLLEEFHPMQWGKGEQENPSKPVWTIAVCAPEDSHRPWTRLVSAVRPAPRGLNAGLLRVGLPWCQALCGARAATALCPCQVPGCGFVLSILGQPLLLWHPCSPKSGRSIVKICLADFPVLGAGPLGPNTWLY